jgi:hypothetical protein
VHTRTALPVIVAAILLMRAAGVSADSSATALAPGVVIVPPAWAGVWDVIEETTTAQLDHPPPIGSCGSGSVTTRSYRDTLCAGETIQVFPSPYPPPIGCLPGGFTDTALQLFCNDWYGCHTCCVYLGPNGYAEYGYYTYNATWDVNWSLVGDVATTTVTYRSEISKSPECGGYRGTCVRTTGTRTRVWPESSICGEVPVLRHTWGRLKLRYR